MAPKDRLFAAARSASGQPQTQGEKDARHSAHAGATTTAEAASDAAASPETETHESDAQETKPTAASAPKPEADAKEAGAAGVPEFKADPAAAPAPAPSPALTTPLEAASDADASPKTETEGAAEGGAKGVPEGEGKSYVMHATTSTERECLALCVLGCSSNTKLMRALAGVTAGSKMYLLNKQTRKVRGPLIALGAAGKNLVRGAFGGRFDLHVRVEKAEKPPVVWVCGADDALPAVGPWTPPRAGGGFEARAQGQGRGRGGGAAKPLTGLAAKEAYYGALRKRSPLAPKSLNVQIDRRALATAAAALKKEIDADQTAMWRAKAQLTKKKEDLDRLEKTLAAMDDGAY
jgi:hypothetical protein